MRITRSQSIYISIALIVAFGMFSGLAIYLSRSSKVAGPTLAQLQHLLPEAKVAMEKFQRSEVKDGKKVWEIEAQRGEYSPASGEAVLVKTNLTLYRPVNEVINIQSDNAALKLEGTQLKVANLSGNVVIVRNNALKIQTEQAIYDKDANLVTGSQKVVVSQESNSVAADSFEAKLNTSEVLLKGHVVSRIIFSQEKKR